MHKSVNSQRITDLSHAPTRRQIQCSTSARESKNLWKIKFNVWWHLLLRLVWNDTFSYVRSEIVLSIQLELRWLLPFSSLAMKCATLRELMLKRDNLREKNSHALFLDGIFQTCYSWTVPHNLRRINMSMKTWVDHEFPLLPYRTVNVTAWLSRPTQVS